MSVNNLVLPSELTIANVSEWKDKLVDILKAGKAITIDGSKLNRMDTASLQLLTVFIRDASAKQLDVSWSSVSEDLKQSAGVLGLSEMLALPR